MASGGSGFMSNRLRTAPCFIETPCGLAGIRCQRPATRRETRLRKSLSKEIAANKFAKIKFPKIKFAKNKFDGLARIWAFSMLTFHA
jgi:hypothetical protein